jgi:hypothetical protein
MIQFTGLEIDEHCLKSRRIFAGWPVHWTRFEIQVAGHSDPVKEIEHWIEENLSEGRYGIYAQKIGFSSSTTIVLGFESNNDALMFKLLDGHLAHKQEE